jgi:hypothetical protein
LNVHDRSQSSECYLYIKRQYEKLKNYIKEQKKRLSGLFESLLGWEGMRIKLQAE